MAMHRSLIVAITLAAFALADDHSYQVSQQIPLFLDQVLPYYNPSESYPYYMLKYCKKDTQLNFKSQDLGEYLQGSRKVESDFHDIRFRTDATDKEMCTMDLTAEDVEDFRMAIKHQWLAKMHIDDIPLQVYVGDYVEQTGKTSLYVKHIFNMTYHKSHIIDAHIEPDISSKVTLEEKTPTRVTFAYSVIWHPTDVTFEDRPSNNPRYNYPEDFEIQWFAIINSFILVVLLTGFLAFITLKLLNKDFKRYNLEDDDDEGDDSGWKLIHTDVFRIPANANLLAAILGCGVQLLMVFVSMLTLSVLGVFYSYGRGTMYACIIFLYTLTAIFAGYVSGSYYKKFKGKHWVHNVLLTVSLFAFPVFVMWSFLNSVAWAHGSTAALPFGTIMGLFALYFLVAFPLTLAGGIAGKHTAGDLGEPCRTKEKRAPIPAAPWYRGRTCHILVAGFLPFSAIYVELYYVFMSLWGHEFLTKYSILCLVFGILIMVTACITVSLTYLQLSIQDHEWWWRSLISGGATSFFMYAYSFHYWIFESNMYGDLQLFFYFGYMFIICYAVFLVLGTIGFLSSLTFVKTIYGSIKID